MADGSGVSGLQPAIKGSSVVTGDPATLIRLLLQGPDKALPADRESYANPMPVFSGLLDGEIAAILSYVRRAFGDDSATSVTPEQVASMRRGRR
jgi:mono/diheme cytochrome c family protein